MTLCNEIRRLVDATPRRSIYLAYKESLYETCPLFLPRLRSESGGSPRAIDDTGGRSSRMFDLDDIKDFIDEYVFSVSDVEVRHLIVLYHIAIEHLVSIPLQQGCDSFNTSRIHGGRAR